MPTSITSPRASRLLRPYVCLLLALLVGALLTASSASAAPLSPDSFGVNVTIDGGPHDLSVASAGGLGVARMEINQGTNADSIVSLAAAAHLQLYPMLGLPTTETPSAAASAMAQYVTSFAQRYGRNGTFWSEHPQLPYEPVESYEIGNEPNIPLQWIADNTHLHWTDPTAYAQVYEASESALHAVDPAAVAVVGGLADSASYGVDIAHDEQWLAALTPGTVDAVGYHPYTFDVSNTLMRSDTLELRQWMDANGMKGVPIDVNEVGACDITTQTTDNSECPAGTDQSSAAWGAFSAGYTEWALCTPALDVRSVVPEYWGGIRGADQNVILPLVSSEMSLTPYGQAFLDEATLLTTKGCPPVSTSGPAVSGNPVVGQLLTADPGTWTGSSAPTYQWQSCDASGQSCADIPGATSTSYLVQSANIGQTLVVAVTVSNTAGSTTASSAPTGVVSSGLPGGGGTTTTPPPTTTPPGPPTTTTPPAPTKPIPPTVKAQLASMGLQISRIKVHGRLVSLTVSDVSGSGRVIVSASAGHGHTVDLHGASTKSKGHAARSKGHHATVTFSAKLRAGRWTVTVTCKPAHGYATPKAKRQQVTVRG